MQVGDAGEESCERAVEHVDKRHLVRRGERRGGLGADQASPDHDHAPVRDRETLAERNQTGGGGVLLSPLEAGNRRLWVAQARRPDEGRRFELELATLDRAAHDESSAVKVARGHDSVDVLDASLDKLRRVGKERHATGQQRSFGEGWAIVRQTGTDQYDGHIPVGEPGRARVPGDAIADDNHQVAHARHVSALGGRTRRCLRL